MKPSKLTLFITAFFLAFGIFLIGSKLFADSGSNMYGYLWSSNIGWLDTNDCGNPADSTTCHPSASFGISVLPSAPGTMSGYAWSSNIGWITFNASGCPTSGCTPGAYVSWNGNGSGTVHGWAQACSVYASGCSGALKDNAYLGTWDGYIALDSTTAGGSGGNWGLTISGSKDLSGYAWGSQVVGWIKDFNASIYTGGPTVTLTPNPAIITSGASSVLTATASAIDGANACTIPGVNGLVMKQSGGTWSGTVTVSPTDTTTYIVSCTKGNQVAKAQATVAVNYFNTPSTGGGSGGGYCSSGNPQFAWNTDATSCKIVRSDGASQTVLPTSCDENTTEGVHATGTDGRCYYPAVQLPLLSSTTTYSLQCTGGSKPINYPLTVTECGEDFTLQAVPTNGNASGAEPFTVKSDGSATATYTVSAVPSGAQFTSPITLSVLPYQPGTGASPLPSDATLTFSTTTLTNSGGKYNTATFTITIPSSKELGGSASYTPIIIQGTGGGYIRQAQVSANTTTNTPPIFKEF